MITVIPAGPARHGTRFIQRGQSMLNLCKELHRMILEILEKRFTDNRSRHPELDWQYVENRLKNDPQALVVLRKMEESGGEPDTIGSDGPSGRLIF